MNTALRKTRKGISQTFIFAGEATPEGLVELREGWAALAGRGFARDLTFETDVFLTDAPADPGAKTLDDFLPFFRVAADYAQYAIKTGIRIGRWWDPNFGWITSDESEGPTS